jgi:hypothetical protein
MRLQCEHSIAPFVVGWFHAYATVNDYTNNQLSGQALVAAKRTFAIGRLEKDMFAYFEEVFVCISSTTATVFTTTSPRHICPAPFRVLFRRDATWPRLRPGREKKDPDLSRDAKGACLFR